MSASREMHRLDGSRIPCLVSDSVLLTCSLFDSNMFTIFLRLHNPNKI